MSLEIITHGMLSAANGSPSSVYDIPNVSRSVFATTHAIAPAATATRAFFVKGAPPRLMYATLPRTASEFARSQCAVSGSACTIFPVMSSIVPYVAWRACARISAPEGDTKMMCDQCGASRSIGCTSERPAISAASPGGSGTWSGWPGGNMKKPPISLVGRSLAPGTSTCPSSHSGTHSLVSLPYLLKA
eukprot:2925329-Rhodomonas_salina.1